MCKRERERERERERGNKAEIKTGHLDELFVSIEHEFRVAFWSELISL